MPLTSTAPDPALARARSLRKPSTAALRNNVSPSRRGLPVKGGQAGLTRTGTPGPTRTGTPGLTRTGTPGPGAGAGLMRQPSTKLAGSGMTDTGSRAPTRLGRSASSAAATAGATAARSARPVSGVYGGGVAGRDERRVTSTSTSTSTSRPSLGSGLTAAREKKEGVPAPGHARTASARLASLSGRPTTPGVSAAVARRVASTVSLAGQAKAAAAGVNDASSGSGPAGPRHLRSKSSVIGSSSLSGPNILRPPSQSSTASSSTTTTTTTTVSKSDRARPPLTSVTRRAPANSGSGSGSTSAVPPSPTGTRRPLSLSSLPGAASGLTRRPSASAKPRAAGTSTPTPTATPTTSTFPVSSPSKRTANPNPTTATTISNVTVNQPPETTRLQAELLALHLLHRDAPSVRAEWMGSARDMLHDRFEALKVQEEGVRMLRGEVEGQRVVGDLVAWSHSGIGIGGLEEKVAVLDGIVSGLWAVVGGGGGNQGEETQTGGGRYERVERGFEAWVGGVERAVRARRVLDDDDDDDDDDDGGDDTNANCITDIDTPSIFLPPLSPAWREEHAALVRRLTEWRRQLRELGDVPQINQPQPANGETSTDGEGEETQKGEGEESPSSLRRILAGCRALVHGMLDELALMETVEEEARADEMAWVRGMNRREGGESATPRAGAGAIWRGL